MAPRRRQSLLVSMRSLPVHSTIAVYFTAALRLIRGYLRSWSTHWTLHLLATVPFCSQCSADHKHYLEAGILTQQLSLGCLELPERADTAIGPGSSPWRTSMALVPAEHVVRGCSGERIRCPAYSSVNRPTDFQYSVSRGAPG